MPQNEGWNGLYLEAGIMHDFGSGLKYASNLQAHWDEAYISRYGTFH
jgi:hypothetical protein